MICIYNLKLKINKKVLDKNKNKYFYNKENDFYKVIDIFSNQITF